MLGDEGLDLLYAHRPVARRLLSDLMEAVEALCPSWPARPQRMEPAGFRL